MRHTRLPVVHVDGFVVVLDVAEAAETFLVHVGLEGPVVGHNHVHAQVELLAPDQERPVDGDDVLLVAPFGAGLLLDLRQLAMMKMPWP